MFFVIFVLSHKSFSFLTKLKVSKKIKSSNVQSKRRSNAACIKNIEQNKSLNKKTVWNFNLGKCKKNSVQTVTNKNK